MDDHKIFESASRFLDGTRDTLSRLSVPKDISKAVRAVLDCRGTIITTGMGKAGHAARKCSSSLCSLSFRSCYIHPGDAAHGDIGVACPGDVIIAFSTSGKTREVVETIGFAKKLGVSHVIAITSHPDGPIREISDIVIDMGVVEEAGHLGIAPTTSIVTMLILSDIIALTSAEMKGITIEDYGLRHHGGYLGMKCRGEEK
jgi:arabinose-5-phosphate isomerase